MKLRPKYRLVEHFAEIDDPRIERTKRHKLIDILTIAILAVICGADSWVGMESFGKAKHQWLKTILELPHGIPSHDTFARVFARLNPEQFQNCFLNWVKSIEKISEREVIAIDGKTLRQSYDKAKEQGAIQMVSAWATVNRLVLGQCKVESKSNEITAIPKLLKMLEVKGCIVTIDAMGTQTKIAQQIVEQEGDYVLALKGNQGNLCKDVEQLFAHAQSVNFVGIKHDFQETIDKGHGRIEIRRCWAMEPPEFLLGGEKWANLTSISMIQAERRLKGKIEYETRYYISSLPSNAQKLSQSVRSHWLIENSLHWVLDLAFNEDACRIRKDFAPENLAVVRHIALNLLTKENTLQLGIKNKRLRAGWDEDYLLKILFG
jgi:predicted transposase YbfD/YdcC